jgi:hypothetical protein
MMESDILLPVAGRGCELNAVVRKKYYIDEWYMTISVCYG